MIYDCLENLNQYTGMFETLDAAIAFLEECELETLALGRTDIDTKKGIYLTVAEKDTRPAGEEGVFETHSRCFEIHIDIKGSEIVEIALGELQQKQEYDQQTDCALWQADCSAACTLDEDRFLICMTEEPHKALVAAAGFSKVKKCVVTVPREA